MPEHTPTDWVIEKIINEDGTDYNPPKNPLAEKWKKLYPSCSNDGDTYKCIYCGKCPYGEYWYVPEEDRDEFNKYGKVLAEYDAIHNPSLYALRKKG